MDGLQARKKGRSCHERPKSREETPKEGYDYPSRARDVAMQNVRVHCTIFKCNFCRAAHTETKSSAKVLRSEVAMGGAGNVQRHGKKAVRARTAQV